MASYLDDKFSIDSDKHNFILREKKKGKKVSYSVNYRHGLK